MRKKIWQFAGGEFNINSPKQLGEILFDKLQLGGSKVKKNRRWCKINPRRRIRKNARCTPHY
jgi:DNA polymerase I-like protein with 3'-5' exonuclease and polymerase domains